MACKFFKRCPNKDPDSETCITGLTSEKGFAYCGTYRHLRGIKYV